MIAETEAAYAPLEADAAEHVCHVLVPGTLIAVCGHDCKGRHVHSETTCVLEHHPRCFECARREGGGVDRFLRDLLDDSPF